MRAWRTSPNTAQEDTLFDYGDRLASGQMPPPRDALEAMAARVHQTLRSQAPVPQRMPESLKAALWEEIMRSVTHTAQTPVNRLATTRHAASSRMVTLPPDISTRPAPNRMWTWAGHIALALVVLLAGAGALRGIGRIGAPGEPTVTPAFAIQAATPVPSTSATGERLVATPGAQTTCDLHGDIPLIPDLTESKPPVAMTSLYVVQHDQTRADPRGDLLLACADQEPVVLARNIVSAWPGPWPGTVALMTLPPGTNELSDARRAYLNIRSGAMITFGPDKEGTRISQAGVHGSPWVIGPSATDPGNVAVADLRTMDVRDLTELAGATIPAKGAIMTADPATDGTMALAFPASDPTAAPGNLLLLGASFAEARWINLPNLTGEVSELSLSPDGGYAAIVSLLDEEAGPITYRLMVISTADGSVVAESRETSFAPVPFAWIRGGHAIAYVDGAQLLAQPLDPPGAPATIFTAPSPLNGLQTTRDANVLVSATRRDHGSDAPPSQKDRDVVYAINVETGAVHEFPGIDASASVSWNRRAGALVMYQWDDTYPDTATYQVFDPVTGDQIGTITDAPSVQVEPRKLSTLGRNSVALSDDGKVEVIAFGTQHIYAFVAGPTGMTMRKVTSPQGMLSEMFLTANVFVSPSGTHLSLNGEEDEGRTRYLISLNDPQANWIAIPNIVVGEGSRGLITFVAASR